MDDNRKSKAIKLRQCGWSINAISKELQAAKSSISIWTRDVILSDKQITNLRAKSHTPQAIELRRQTRLANEERKRSETINKANTEVGILSRRELWLIGTALYWAEGGKTQRTVRFSNGDPNMIQFMMRYFREVCEVPEDKFRGYIHIHDSLDHIIAEQYWSAIANIPTASFYKTYRKPNPSSKGLRDTLPYGVFDIYVADVTLFLKIQGWTKGIYKNKPHVCGG